MIKLQYRRRVALMTFLISLSFHHRDHLQAQSIMVSIVRLTVCNTNPEQPLEGDKVTKIGHAGKT